MRIVLVEPSRTIRRIVSDMIESWDHEVWACAHAHEALSRHRISCQVADQRALGDNDVRHRFTLAFLTESPKEWPIVVRDFKFSLLSSLQSARYFSMNAGFDTNGDSFPFNDRVGVSARNSYKGDPFYDVDLRLQRVIPFTERIKGEASIEVFNLFNRPNVEDVDHVYGLPDFVGPVPKEFGDHIAPPPPGNTGLVFPEILQKSIWSACSGKMNRPI